MANKIAGITVEIGGDTSKLGKALEGVNTKTKTLQGELKNVNSLLKFDPTNVTLVKQKQDLLNESLANSKEKLNTLEAAQEQVQAQFDKGDITIEQYREFEREIESTRQKVNSYEKQIAALDEEQNNLETGTKQLNTILEATGTDLDSYQDILGSRLTNALKNGTASSDDLTVAINKIGKEALGSETDLDAMREALNKVDDDGIESVKDELTQLSPKLQNTSDNADETANSISKIADNTTMQNYDTLGQKVSDMSDKLVEAAKKALEAFDTIDEGADNAIKATGATGDAAEALEESYKNVVANFPTDDYAAVGNAVGEVNTQFGYTGEELEETTTLMLKFSEITGSDVVDSTQSAAKIINKFGLENSDLESVLDSVAAAAQNTGVSTDTLFDAIYSNSSVLQTLNLNVDQSATLLSGMEQAGVDSTTVLKKLTKASSTYADEGKTLSEGLLELKDNIDGASSKTEKLSYASEVFGDASAEKMLEAIENGTLDLEALADQADTTSGTVTNTFDETHDSGDSMQESTNQCQVALADLGEVLSNTLAPILSRIADVVEKVVNWFTSLPGPVQDIVVAIGLAVVAIGIAIPIVLSLAAAATTLEVSILPIIAVVVAVIAVIAAIIVIIKNWGEITDWISEKWSEFKEWITGIFDSIKEKITDAFENIKTKISDTVTNVVETIKSLPGKIKEKLNTVLTKIKEWGTSLKEKGKAAILKLINIVVDKLKSFPQNVMTKLSLVINKVKEWGTSLKEKGKAAAKTLVNAVINGIKNLPEKVKEVGKNLIHGIWEGITNAKDWLIEKVKGLATTITDGIKSALGIASPSKVMRDEVGKWIPAGIADGITAAADKVNQAMTATVDGMFNTANETINGSMDIGTTVTTNIPESFANAAVSSTSNVVNNITISANSVDTAHIDEICNAINQKLGRAY